MCYYNYEKITEDGLKVVNNIVNKMRKIDIINDCRSNDKIYAIPRL